MPEQAPTPETATGMVADAAAGNWVDRWAPPATRPYLRLSRADRPNPTWLLFLPCAWSVLLAAAASGWRLGDAWILLGCGIGALLMRGAGCTWNDIADRDIDGHVARTRSRPLPSGQTTVRKAVAWMVAQSLLAFGILLTFSPTAIALGIGSLAVVCVYPFAKRFTWWPQAFLGLAFNWGALLGWAAHANALAWPAVALFGAGIAWTLFYDTIYAHQDAEDDALIGVRSTARLFGERSPVWLRRFLAAFVVCAGLSVWLALGDAPRTVFACAAIGVAAMAAHMAWQLKRLDIDDPDLCRTIFLSNREAGLLLAAGLSLAVAVAHIG